MSPRHKRPAVEIEEPEVEETMTDLDLPTPEQMEDAQRLSDFQARFGGKDYKVRVDRYNKEDAEWEYATSCKLDGFDPFVSLQKSHGGGRFRLTLLDDAGRYVKGGRQEIRIAEPIGKSEPEVVKVSPMQDPGVQAIIAMMQAQAAQNSDLLKTIISAQATKPAEQPIAELVGALSKLQGLVPREGDSMKGVKDALELLTAAKGLLPEAKEAEASGGVLSEVLEAVKAGKELGFFDRYRQPPPQRLPPTPGTVLAPSGVVPLSRPPLEATMPAVNPITEKVSSYIPLLVSWAKRNETVEDAGDFVVSELMSEVVPVVVANYHPLGLTLNAETVLTHLLEKAKDPAEVERIFDFAPALAEYREWMLCVVAEAVRIIENPAEVEAPVEPEAAS
jgi:hypothetical protein